MGENVVIIGSGQAGLQTAVSLRQLECAGAITLVGREPHLPYQRPPLSKQILTGEWEPARCLLRHAEFYAEHDLRLLRDRMATQLNPAHRHVLLDDGTTLDYDALVICTGARPNRLRFSGAELEGVCYLRTLDEAQALAAQLQPGAALTIVGGGFIGMEVAASARSRQCRVNIIESQPRVMQRSVLEPVSNFLQARHEQRGVAFHLQECLSAAHGDRRVESVSLDDGRRIATDLLLVAVGVRPDLEWLEGSGIECGRGVHVDTHGRTSIDGIYAAGDVAETLHPLLPGRQVLESVQNAVSQGKAAAASIAGRPQPYTEVPWFWSEQYHYRFQMAGLPRPDDELVSLDTGQPDSLCLLSVGGERLHAVQCINSPQDYMAGRRLIGLAKPLALDRLDRPGARLKELL